MQRQGPRGSLSGDSAASRSAALRTALPGGGELTRVAPWNGRDSRDTPHTAAGPGRQGAGSSFPDADAKTTSVPATAQPECPPCAGCPCVPLRQTHSASLVTSPLSGRGARGTRARPGSRPEWTRAEHAWHPPRTNRAGPGLWDGSFRGSAFLSEDQHPSGRWSAVSVRHVPSHPGQGTEDYLAWSKPRAAGNTLRGPGASLPLSAPRSTFRSNACRPPSDYGSPEASANPGHLCPGPASPAG